MTAPETAARDVLAERARQIAAEQERLGTEFEAVLFDNLWALYVRSPLAEFERLDREGDGE